MKPPVPRLRYCHLNNEYSATCSNPPAAIPRNRTKSDRALVRYSSLFKTNNADSWKTHSDPRRHSNHADDTRALHVCKQENLTELLVCSAGWTFSATSRSWLQSFARYLFEGNIKARLSQRFQKASRANQKGTVTAKGTSGLPMMDDKKEGRQRRRKRERDAGGRERERERQDRRAKREITGERGELMWKVSLIRWNVCPLPQIPSCGAGRRKKKTKADESGENYLPKWPFIEG